MHAFRLLSSCTMCKIATTVLQIGVLQYTGGITASSSKHKNKGGATWLQMAQVWLHHESTNKHRHGIQHQQCDSPDEQHAAGVQLMSLADPVGGGLHVSM